MERYADPDQAIVVTGLADGLQTWGASIGLDVTFAERVLWRTEARGFRADDAVWPDGDGPPSQSDGFVVASLAVTF